MTGDGMGQVNGMTGDGMGQVKGMTGERNDR